MDETNPHFYNTTITIQGPGGTLWDEIELIKRALESHGLKVKIQDQYPVTMEQKMLDIRLNDIRDANLRDGGHGVKLIVVHLPWSG